jgi:hypothetical protein
LVVVRPFLREEQLDLGSFFASISETEKGFPNTKRRGLFRSLREEGPGAAAVGGPADGDAEVGGLAGRGKVVVSEGGEDGVVVGRELKEEEVVAVPGGAGHFAMWVKGPALVDTSCHGEDALVVRAKGCEACEDGAVREVA